MHAYSRIVEGMDAMSKTGVAAACGGENGTGSDLFLHS